MNIWIKCSVHTVTHTHYINYLFITHNVPAHRVNCTGQLHGTAFNSGSCTAVPTCITTTNQKQAKLQGTMSVNAGKQ